MALSKRVRYEVLRRDDHACRYCGGMAPDVKLTIDHVVPVALGGSDEPTNLVTACADCNAGKTSVAPDQALVDDVDERAIEWADAMRRAGEMLSVVPEPQREYVEAFDSAWNRWTAGFKKAPIARANNWEEAVTDLYRGHLPVEMMVKAVDIACAAYNVDDEFAYFMGVCRRMLREQHAVAQALIEQRRAGN